MPVRVDRKADILTVYLSEVTVCESAEVATGIIADYDTDGRVVGLEIHDASKRKNTPISGIAQSLGEVRKNRGTLTKQPHYVWAFHLRAWADPNGNIQCYWLQQKKLESTTANNISKAKFFYRTHRLSNGDMAYLSWLVDNATLPGLREINRSTMRLFQEIYDVKYLLEELNVGSEGRAALNEHVRFAEKMLGERYHGLIEDQGRPFLEQLRRQDASFSGNPSDFHTFLFFICQQLFRTAKMRNIIVNTFKKSPVINHDPKRTGPIEQHIYANNVSAGMISESHKYKIIFLNNNSSRPFITSDQPVVNIRFNDSEDMKLYYPLSPNLAIFICVDEFISRTVSDIEVELLNYKIFEACEDQVYCNNKDYLRDFVTIGKLDMKL